jgi:hypothetical protein
MADFPLACCIEGDYGFKLLIVDDADSIDEVAAKAASKLVGVTVPVPVPGSHFRVRIPGSAEYLPRTVSVRESGLVRMDPIEILSVPP